MVPVPRLGSDASMTTRPEIVKSGATPTGTNVCSATRPTGAPSSRLNDTVCAGFPDVIVQLLAALNGEVLSWLKEALRGKRTIERTAAEHLVELAATRGLVACADALAAT
jgi:hypothetical protein